MSDQFSEIDVAKAIGHPFMLGLGAFLTWLTAGSLGPALKALLSIIGGISFLAFSLMHRRYLGILAAGGDPQGSPECESYASLRASLAKGGLAGRLYALRLTRFLDAVDRFFGDAGMASRSLFPHAFGLRAPAPLWTPRSFDRCLFLALIYPIATIFAIWMVSGHVGPAEMALGLKPNVSGWSRILIAAAAGLGGIATWNYLRGETRKSVFWLYASFVTSTSAAAGADAIVALGAVMGAVAVTFAFGSCGVGAVAFGIAMAASVASAGRVAGALTVAVAVPIAFALAFGLGGASHGATALTAAAAAASSIAILLICAAAIKHQAQGTFLFWFIPAAIVACLAVVKVLLPLQTWPYTGPLLLFLGLLTLVNAPFNWASIGLTRALLRRGLELGGWWPYVLALVNALLAAVLVTLLTLTMVVAVQAFDEVVTHAGGDPVLPLGPLFDGIAHTPGAPVNWWIYALLLATMSPSLINLMTGGASMIAGVPGLPSLLLRFMPEGKAVPVFDRTWLAIVLTLQTFFGAILGIAAEAFLAVGVIRYLMPFVGPDLLAQARAVAALDLPARAGGFLVALQLPGG